MLSKNNRLKKLEDFENVRHNGKFLKTEDFTFTSFNRKDKEPSRFGIIVSKKVSMKATARNKVKRQIREILRKNISSVKDGFDFVISAKSSIIHASRATIETELKECLKDY